jgi:toxin HigB-1
LIKSFRHKGLTRLFETGERRGVTPLELVDRFAETVRCSQSRAVDERFEFARLPVAPAKGNRSGTWSVTVSGNWRVTFTFEGEDSDHRFQIPNKTNSPANPANQERRSIPEMISSLHQARDL